MIFPNTTSMMKELQNASQIHLEQVMQLIEKLFTDIQYQTGDLVEDCRIENMNLLVPALSAVTNDIVYIFRNHEEEIQDAQHKYLDVLAKAQSACNGCQEQLNTIHQTIQSLEAEEAKLTVQKQEAELQRSAAGELEHRVRELQEQIDQLTGNGSNGDIGSLRQDIATREAQLQALTDQLAQDRARMTELEKQIHAQQTEVSQAGGTVHEQELMLAALEAQLQKLEADKVHAAQRIAEKQQQVRQGMEGQKANQAQLERIQAVLAQCDETLAQQREELAELSSRESEKNREISLSQEQLNALKGRLEAQEKLFTEQQTELHTTQTRLKHAQTSLQQVREEIAGIQAQILSAEQVLSDERATAEALKSSLFSVTSDVEYKKTDNDNYRKEFLEPAEAQLAALVAQIDADKKRYQELETELAQKKDLRASNASANSALENSIRYTQEKLEEQEKIHRKNAEALAVLEAALSEKNSAVEALVDTQNKLRELLNGRDTDQIQQDLIERNHQLEENIRQADGLEVKIREVQGAINTAQDRLDRAHSELDSLLGQEKALRDALDDVTAQLDQANSEQNRTRSASLQNQLDILHGLADRLSAGTVKACGDKFVLDRMICDSLNTAEQTIQTIRQTICEYAGYRQSALEASD